MHAVEGSPPRVRLIRIVQEVPVSFVHAIFLAATAFFLLGTAVIAAIAGDGTGVGTAAAVSLIAALAYAAMARLRLAFPVEGAPVQALADALRSCDWLITFPLMQLELMHELGRTLRNDTGVVLGVMALGFGTILFDTIARLSVGPLRRDELRRYGRGITRSANGPLLLQAVGYVLSTACFIPLMWLYWDRELAEKASTTQRNAVRVFVTGWLAYPCISVMFDWLHSTTRGESHPRIALAKDLCFAIADVMAKGFLALYVTAGVR